MNFYIDIIDTENSDLITALEDATKNSIVLEYNGSDDLDELLLVGSSLAFTVLVHRAENVDGALAHLYTSDEQRYKVELYQASEDVAVADLLVWQGFLLPDAYKEPYKSGVLPISLEATDGLGRLKGKYLEDSFYTTENSVVEIVAACLQLTGLEMPIVFAPAIDNTVEKNWHLIYLSGDLLYSDNDKQDAATILEDLLTSMLSLIYQHLGKWYVEGYNKRSLQSYDAKLYTAQGVYSSETTITKVVRDVNNKFIATPNVSIVPAYGIIDVTGTQKPLVFEETLYKEENDGWSAAIGVVEEVYATNWQHSDKFKAKAKAPDYNVYLESRESYAIGLRAIQLLKKLYIRQNTKVKLVLEFEIDYFGTENSNTIDNLIASGDWQNPFDYFIYLGTELIFTNTTVASLYNRNLDFNADKEAAVTLEFIAQHAGLLNVVFAQPYLDISDTKISGVFIKKMTIEDVAFSGSLKYEYSTAADYTVTKELELPFVDDASGLSKSFRLAKLDAVFTNQFTEIPVPILSAFTQNGNYYSVVQLDGANLIADNIDSVLYGGPLVDVIDVIYNYNNGEQMVVQTAAPYTSGMFNVLQLKVKHHDLDRAHWEHWTDSVYNVETKRFGAAVLGVLTRLYDTAFPMVEGTISKLPVLFGDLLSFNYQEEGLFLPTYTSLNLDSGNAQVRISKSNYLLETNLVEPYVNAGPDLFLYNNESQISIDATAYDPDGTIVSYLWEQVSGDTTAVFSATDVQDITLTGLTGDAYEFRLTVTDNDGLTASDSVMVYRSVSYAFGYDVNVILEEQYTFYRSNYNAIYQIDFAPNLSPDVLTTLMYSYSIQNIVGESNGLIRASLVVTKNNIVLEEIVLNSSDGNSDTGTFLLDGQFVISYISTDTVEFEIDVWVQRTGGAESLHRCTVNLDLLGINTSSNQAQFTGVPNSIEVIREIDN